jgi:hypothetical protein
MSQVLQVAEVPLSPQAVSNVVMSDAAQAPWCPTTLTHVLAV